jgi:hypothetical protein
MRTYGHISEWDTSKVTSMKGLFKEQLIFNVPIGEWDTSNVTTMKSMFRGAIFFNQPLQFDTSNVEDMSHMFNGANSFNQPLTFNTRKVTDMSYMFHNPEDDDTKETEFNQPLKWDTSNVINMSFMFAGATSFNKPLKWDTSNVVNMSFMFAGAVSFNRPLDFTDTSKVIDMSHMFAGARSFNRPIDAWDVRNVREMGGMFERATAFDQSLSRWHAIPVECYADPPMFADAPLMLHRYPDGIITPTRRFRWQRLCDASVENVDELRALATAAHIPGAAEMPKRTLCSALSRLWAEQKVEQARVAPDCKNRVGLLQTPVEDIAPEFFYSYEQDGLRYCDDIRDLHEYVRSRPRAENPYTKVPYDEATLGGIRVAYAHVQASAERMDDFDDEPVVALPFQTLLTQKLADLMSKLNYPNDLELFRHASLVRFRDFVDALQQSGVVSPNDRTRINEPADLDHKKAFLVDLLRLKIAQDREQTQTAHGPISRVAYEVSNLYNDIFI